MAEPFFGRHTIYGVEGDHDTPYMTRYWIGRLRFHIFHRGDEDPDPHDHPWSFTTFPFNSYVEEIAEPDGAGGFIRKLRVVRAFRLHHRQAEFAHRVLGRWTGETIVSDFTEDFPVWEPGKIFTIVWRGRGSRRWGFWKEDGDKWCWRHWKEYVFSGGKYAPCSLPEEK